jgi:hypothetical protein
MDIEIAAPAHQADLVAENQRLRADLSAEKEQVALLQAALRTAGAELARLRCHLADTQSLLCVLESLSATGDGGPGVFTEQCAGHSAVY